MSFGAAGYGEDAFAGEAFVESPPPPQPPPLPSIPVVVASGVNVVDLDPNMTPVQASIARMDGGVLDVNGRLDAGNFGLTAAGVAYFDSGGATIGETAAFGWDGAAAQWILVLGGIVSNAESLHLMLQLEAPELAGSPIGRALMPAQASSQQIVGCAPGMPAMPPEASAERVAGCAPGTAAMPSRAVHWIDPACAIGRPAM